MNVKEIVIWKHFLIWKITTTKYIFNPNNQEPNTPWSIHFCRVLDNDIAEPDHIYIYVCISGQDTGLVRDKWFSVPDKQINPCVHPTVQVN